MESADELGVRQAPGDERQHLTLAPGELVEVSVPLRRHVTAATEVRDQPAGDARRQERLTRCDDTDGAQQFLDRLFSTKPLAPACSALKTYSSRSKVVSTRGAPAASAEVI